MDPILAQAVRALYQQPGDTDAEQFIRQQTGGKYGVSDAKQYLQSIQPPSNSGILNSIGKLLTYSPTNPVAAATELANPSSGARDVARSLGEGMTMGWGDELVGKLPAALGGGPAAEADMRNRLQAMSTAHPVLDRTLQMAGGIAPSLLLPEVGATTALGRIGVGALLGAGTGAAAGAGYADEGNRVGAAEGGAAIGGLLGAAIPASVAGYRALSVPWAARRLAGAVDRSGGAPLLNAKANAFDRAGLGGVTTLGDLSDPLRAEAKYVATNHPDAAMQRIRATQARTAGTPQRMLDKLRSLLPEFGPDPNAPTEADALQRTISDWAAGPEGYGGLRAAGEVPNTPSLMPGSESAELSQAKANLSAAKKMGIGGRNLQDLEQRVIHLTPPANPQEEALRGLLGQPMVREAVRTANMTGQIGDVLTDPATPTFAKMFQVKEKLDAAADRNLNAAGGDKALGFRLRNAAQMVDQHMQDNMPGYAKVKSEYRRLSGLHEAFDLGHAAMASGDSREISANLANLSPEQLHNARLAMASDLTTALRRPDGGMATARQLMRSGAEGSSESALKDKLSAMFGNEDRAQAYLDFAAKNQELQRMTGAYGGSDTYQKFMAGEGSPMETVLSKGASGLAYRPSAFARSVVERAVSNRLLRSLRVRTAAGMAEPLMATGPSAIRDALAAIGQSPALPGRVASQVAPMTLANLLHP